MPGQDALKALSRLHQQQYAVPPTSPMDPYESYIEETQTADTVAPPEEGISMPEEHPVLSALRKLRETNFAG